MKKIFTAALAAVMALALYSCGAEKPENESSKAQDISVPAKTKTETSDFSK